MTFFEVILLLLNLPVVVVLALAPRGMRNLTLLALAVGPDIALQLRTEVRCDRKHRSVTLPDGCSIDAESKDDYDWVCKRLLFDGVVPLSPAA